MNAAELKKALGALDGAEPHEVEPDGRIAFGFSYPYGTSIRVGRRFGSKEVVVEISSRLEFASATQAATAGMELVQVATLAQRFAR